MKAAGFKLPESTKGGRRSVALWAFGLALWEQFWPIVTEATAAGLGAALGLALCLLISTLFLQFGDIGYAFRGFACSPLGLVLGIMAVAAARVVSLAVGPGDVRRQVLGRVIGFGLGFMLGLVLVGSQLTF